MAKKKKDSKRGILPALLVLGGLYLIFRKTEEPELISTPSVSGLTLERSANLTQQQLRELILSEAKAYALSLQTGKYIRYATVATFADIIPPNEPTIFTVTHDEMNDNEETLYYFSNGKLRWVTSEAV